MKETLWMWFDYWILIKINIHKWCLMISMCVGGCHDNILLKRTRKIMKLVQRNSFILTTINLILFNQKKPVVVVVVMVVDNKKKLSILFCYNKVSYIPLSISRCVCVCVCKPTNQPTNQTKPNEWMNDDDLNWIELNEKTKLNWTKISLIFFCSQPLSFKSLLSLL